MVSNEFVSMSPGIVFSPWLSHFNLLSANKIQQNEQVVHCIFPIAHLAPRYMCGLPSTGMECANGLKCYHHIHI